MPVWKNKRTGHTVSADADYIDALGADKYEKVADESADERRLREQEEARAAKVELDDEEWDANHPNRETTTNADVKADDASVGDQVDVDTDAEPDDIGTGPADNAPAVAPAGDIEQPSVEDVEHSEDNG